MSEELSLREIRLQKLARMRELGHDPYAVERFDATGSASQLLAEFPEGGFPENKGPEVAFAGRVVSYRLMGKAGFAHVSDGDHRIQIYVRKDDVGDTGWELYNLLDIGDHVGVEGYLFTTKTGESSIHVSKLIPLSKSLQVLPLGKTREIKDEAGNVVGEETWYGLEDVEQRYRHRHLDLICNPHARKSLIERAKIVSAVREYFNSVGYLEVETPLLQVVAGGAAARPFTTHYNAYEMDVKLRISLELYLKRLICGDVPKVYEIGRVFRNEGVSNRHNPEFTLLEFYEAYTDLEGMMQRVEECFKYVCKRVYGSAIVIPPVEQGLVLDFNKPWKRVDLLDEISRLSGLAREDLAGLETAKAAIRSKGVLDKAHQLGGHIDLNKEDNLGGLIEKLLEVFVEPTLQEPTFVVGYPIETSPLAKKDPKNPRMTRRFEGYIFGREICNAFSEINDPIDQRERFDQQAAELAKGDDEAHPYDEEFLYALEGGMPPTGGCGIGMERLAMVLTGAEHIREIMLFPMMRPKESEE
jgi:lysyl-tRNA synthetase class 2